VNASFGTRIINLRDGWVAEKETSNQRPVANV
jgi:hypothetical protein